MKALTYVGSQTLALLLGLSFLTPAPGAAQAEKAHASHFDKCARACADCQLACDSCFRHCLDLVADGKTEHVKTVQSCADCAECCKLAATLAARRSPFAHHACECCAKCCDDCAAACEKFPDSKHMAECAKECRKCAIECREMLKHKS